ncbi:hypothetical protein SC665_04000 [Legionella pneumophila serogroup 1]
MNSFFDWASDHNAGIIALYHNEMYRLLKLEYQRLIKSEGQNANLKHDYQLFDDYLTINTFLMFYSYAEEWIYLKLKDTTYNSLIGDTGSISRFKIPLKKIGIDISKKGWSIMMEAESIRNCITHCNGRVALNPKNEKLKKTLANKNNQPFFEIKLGRLRILKPYINHFRQAIDGIIKHEIIHVIDEEQMNPYIKEESYKNFKIQYQIINIQNKFEGRAIIKGYLCSSATTTSSESDLEWSEFNSLKDAQDALTKIAYKKIDNAHKLNMHSGDRICAFCGQMNC